MNMIALNKVLWPNLRRLLPFQEFIKIIVIRGYSYNIKILLSKKNIIPQKYIIDYELAH
jgi:hypothetical protein